MEGKTRLKAIGAVLHNASGEVCIVFSSPIKVKESNETKVLATQEALEFSSNSFSCRVVVECDSLNAIY